MASAPDVVNAYLNKNFDDMDTKEHTQEETKQSEREEKVKKKKKGKERKKDSIPAPASSSYSERSEKDDTKREVGILPPYSSSSALTFNW